MKTLFVLLSIIGSLAGRPAGSPEKNEISPAPSLWSVTVICCPLKIIIKNEPLRKENLLTVVSGSAEGDRLTLDIDPKNLTPEEIEGLKSGTVKNDNIEFTPELCKKLAIKPLDLSRSFSTVKNTAVVKVVNNGKVNEAAAKGKKPPFTITITIKINWNK